MARMTFDYHTHTVWSHGTGTVEENAKAALRAGLSAVAISDHAPGHLAYGVRNLTGYLDAIESAAAQYQDNLRILSGIELNLIGLGGKTDLPRDFMDRFHIRILGYHKFTRISGLCSAWHFYIGRNFPGSRYTARTTDAYLRALERYPITIVAHPGYGVPVDYRALAQMCAKTGTLFEINGSHRELTPAVLETAAGEGARFILSSDAHKPSDVGTCPLGIQKALLAGLTPAQVVNLEL